MEELGTEYYAINSDSKQKKVNLVASENGLADKAWTGFNYDAINSEWIWSDGSLSLGYSNWLSEPTDPETFSKAQLLFNKNEPDFGKWKAQRSGNKLNILVCKKPATIEQCVTCDETQNMARFFLSSTNPPRAP